MRPKERKYLNVTFTEQNTVIVCSVCKGIGSLITEELVDYHKREYDYIRKTCTKCSGDGRLVELREKIEIHATDHVNVISYVDAIKGGIDIHSYDSKQIHFRINNQNTELEKKYPKLKEVAYDVYDELLEKYKLIDELKK